MASYLLFDVGGTNIKINGYDQQTGFFKSSPVVFPAKSKAERDTLLENFSSLLRFGVKDLIAPDQKLAGVGFAFPGPFDYVHGISKISGLNKYETIFNFNLGDFFQTTLQSWGYSHVALLFLNDAQAFGLGTQQQSSRQRGLYITLGTGCGSCFVEAGKIVHPDLIGVNATGMIYDAPFKTSTIDDYLSARGLEHLIQESRLPVSNGLELFKAAHDGVLDAQEVFKQFGQQVEEALLPFVVGFKPEELVFGGEISGSLGFIQTGFSQINQQTEIKATINTSLSTMLGLVTKLSEDK